MASRDVPGKLAENPPPHLFVVGCPRSGTNLLRSILDRHPQLALAFDTHFIPRVIETVSASGDPPLTPQLVERVITYHRFRRLDLTEGAARQAAAEARTYGQFVSALYAEYGRRRGKPIIGEKTPDYVLSLPRLHSLFPWAPFVHIIRDGRDVALSTLEWATGDKGPAHFELWREHPVAVCALWWEYQVGSGRRDGAALSYHELRYEDLVARPREVVGGICSFLGLTFDRRMLDFDEPDQPSDHHLGPRKSRGVPTPGMRNWRVKMKESDVELFEAVAGPLLSSLSYERRYASFSPDVVALAEACRARFEAELARHRDKVARKLSAIPVVADAT